MASTIFSLIFPLPLISGLTAIILGVIALYKIAVYKDRLWGKVFAVIGIVMGLGQLLAVIILLFLLGLFLFNTEPFDIRMADIYSIFGKGQKSISYYEKALIELPKTNQVSVNHNEFNIYNNMGLAFIENGKLDKAQEAYSLALIIAKKSMALAYYGMGAVYMDSKEFDEALKRFDKAIEYNPNLVNAYQDKAVTFRKMGRLKDSVAACKETISLFPNFAQAHSSLGLVYEKLGNYEDAIRSHLEAIRLNPGRYFPRDRLYLCFYNLRDNEKIARLLEEFKKIDSFSAENIENKLQVGVFPQKEVMADFDSLDHAHRKRSLSSDYLNQNYRKGACTLR